jgi:ABC-type transport system substrate-binding protein
VDKDFIVKRILQGYATQMHSVIPKGNAFWHCPDVPLYGEGLNREERLRKAHQILQNAGYSWKTAPVDPQGNVIGGEEIRLPDGQPMERFTILTPPADYDPQRAMVGIMIQEWLRMAGIPASARAMGFGSLVEQTKGRRQFDTFVMGYGSLSLDPDYLRSFFHSANSGPRGWNVNGYDNPDFDRLAEASSQAMDPKERKAIIWEMQRLIARDIPLLPLYNPDLVEAARTDRFEGWVRMLGGIGNIWSFCTIRPKEE